jgi:uncharacterized protein YlxW (UPF0749 family)
LKQVTKNSITRNLALTLLCLVLGVVIAFQYKTIDANSKNTVEQYKTLEEMKTALIQEQITRISLENEVQTLTDKNRRLEDSALDEQMAILKEEYNRALILAGLKDVKGKGVIITVGDNPNESIEDTELLKLINILRSVDAQAISINDERIVAMSEITTAENYITINGRPISPPYTVRVIGDQDKIEKTIYMNGGIYQIWTGYDFFMALEKKDDVLIKKIREDSVSLKHDLLNPA